ncbi:hypothetical protein CFBP498_26850 [Xanthomonas hortorum pv. vitians]|uniref:Uncharacterized protein n=2 Tax=Xanthomonas hortorum TaxID=56454 RepID=A0A6V7DSJ8_9XANT|nr:hypothetical protein CFBP498_26850 [Xanthomonas hortorum pv. vitians]CAD0339881.1 hypothetical protein CFBP498_26850 [Xanthomonas hortorum pv. vitians]
MALLNVLINARDAMAYAERKEVTVQTRSPATICPRITSWHRAAM